MNIISTTSFTLATLLVLSSCNSASDKEGFENGGIQNEVTQSDGSNVDGFYAGDIFPINHNLHFKKLGVVGVERSGDNFTVRVRMNNAPREAQIRHSLYTGRRCPKVSDDLNKDAFIDIVETRIALGQIVIPFDGDLSSQRSGTNVHVTSDAVGNYFYSRSTSFELMFTDLKTPDSTIPRYIKKLKADEGITLPGRVVLFQGLNPKVKLPETLKNNDEGFSLHESIPIGCAVLWKVPGAPEELGSI